MLLPRARKWYEASLTSQLDSANCFCQRSRHCPASATACRKELATDAKPVVTELANALAAIKSDEYAFTEIVWSSMVGTTMATVDSRARGLSLQLVIPMMVAPLASALASS